MIGASVGRQDLHPAHQGGVRLPGASTTSTSRSRAGECVVLAGPSGQRQEHAAALRSTATTCPTPASILVRHDGDAWWTTGAAPPAHRSGGAPPTLGYVSQFLRVMPRVPTLDIVAEPLRIVSAWQ
jgi:alpha-D-ribose 1-methylphosphonate 5-triphosphate synthase subunit PhnL